MYEYAIYKGDEFLVVGTKEECADFLGVKPETIVFYTKPAYHRRVKLRKNPEDSLIGEKIKIDESMLL